MKQLVTDLIRAGIARIGEGQIGSRPRLQVGLSQHSRHGLPRQTGCQKREKRQQRQCQRGCVRTARPREREEASA
jgi:hypothetical protein